MLLFIFSKNFTRGELKFWYNFAVHIFMLILFFNLFATSLLAYLYFCSSLGSCFFHGKYVYFIK